MDRKKNEKVNKDDVESITIETVKEDSVDKSNDSKVRNNKDIGNIIDNGDKSNETKLPSNDSKPDEEDDVIIVKVEQKKELENKPKITVKVDGLNKSNVIEQIKKKFQEDEETAGKTLVKDDVYDLTDDSNLSSIQKENVDTSVRTLRSPMIRKRNPVRKVLNPAPLDVLMRVEMETTNSLSAFTSKNLDDYLKSENSDISSFKVETTENNDLEESDDIEMELLPEFDPDFDEVDGLLFMSFTSEDALNAHVHVERKTNIGKNENLLLGMSRIKRLRQQQRQIPSRYQTKFNRLKKLKIQSKINQNLRGMHKALSKYQRLYRLQLEKVFTEKGLQLPVRPVKTLQKTSDITKIKGWKNKYGNAEELAEATGLPLTKSGKIHWRTEERLLKNLNSQELKEIGLNLKKKRRKNLIFTVRKGMSKGDKTMKSAVTNRYDDGDNDDDDDESEEEPEEYESGMKTDDEDMNDDYWFPKYEDDKNKKSEIKINPTKQRLAIKRLNIDPEDVEIIRKLGGAKTKVDTVKESGLGTYLSPSGRVVKRRRKRRKIIHLTTMTHSMALAALKALDPKFVKPKLEPTKTPSAGVIKENTKKSDNHTPGDAALKSCDKPGCRYGCICHLCRLGDQSSDPEISGKSRPPSCDKEYCRLGCICDSIEKRERQRLSSHCGKPECMFECVCSSTDDLKKKLFSPNSSHSDFNNSISALDQGTGEIIPSLSSHDNSFEDISDEKKSRRQDQKVTNLPKRTPTYRLAKNLDAISRKAMLLYETSEMYTEMKARKRKSRDLSQEGLVPSNKPASNGNTPTTKTNQLKTSFSTTSGKKGTVWRSTFQPCPTSSPSQTYNDKKEVFGSDHSFEIESDEEEIKEYTGTSARTIGYNPLIRKSTKKCTCSCSETHGHEHNHHKTKLHSSGEATSPVVISPVNSRPSTPEGLTASQVIKDKQASTETKQPEEVHTHPVTSTDLKVPVPKPQAIWHTQWVCLKANKKKLEEEGQSPSDGVRLLEINSNCNWEVSKQKILSRISAQLSKEGYPSPKRTVDQNWTTVIISLQQKQHMFGSITVSNTNGENTVTDCTSVSQSLLLSPKMAASTFVVSSTGLKSSPDTGIPTKQQSQEDKTKTKMMSHPSTGPSTSGLNIINNGGVNVRLSNTAPNIVNTSGVYIGPRPSISSGGPTNTGLIVSNSGLNIVPMNTGTNINSGSVNIGPPVTGVNMGSNNPLMFKDTKLSNPRIEGLRQGLQNILKCNVAQETQKMVQIIPDKDKVIGPVGLAPSLDTKPTVTGAVGTLPVTIYGPFDSPMSLPVSSNVKFLKAAPVKAGNTPVFHLVPITGSQKFATHLVVSQSSPLSTMTRMTSPTTIMTRPLLTTSSSSSLPTSSVIAPPATRELIAVPVNLTPMNMKQATSHGPSFMPVSQVNNAQNITIPFKGQISILPKVKVNLNTNSAPKVPISRASTPSSLNDAVKATGTEQPESGCSNPETVKKKKRKKGEKDGSDEKSNTEEGKKKKKRVKKESDNNAEKKKRGDEIVTQDIDDTEINDEVDSMKSSGGSSLAGKNLLQSVEIGAEEIRNIVQNVHCGEEEQENQNGENNSRNLLNLKEIVFDSNMTAPHFLASFMEQDNSNSSSFQFDQRDVTEIKEDCEVRTLTGTSRTSEIPDIDKCNTDKSATNKDVTLEDVQETLILTKQTENTQSCDEDLNSDGVLVIDTSTSDDNMESQKCLPNLTNNTDDDSAKYDNVKPRDKNSANNVKYSAECKNPNVNTANREVTTNYKEKLTPVDSSAEKNHLNDNWREVGDLGAVINISEEGLISKANNKVNDPNLRDLQSTGSYSGPNYRTGIFNKDCGKSSDDVEIISFDDMENSTNQTTSVSSAESRKRKSTHVVREELPGYKILKQGEEGNTRTVSPVLSIDDSDEDNKDTQSEHSIRDSCSIKDDNDNDDIINADDEEDVDIESVTDSDSVYKQLQEQARDQSSAHNIGKHSCMLHSSQLKRKRKPQLEVIHNSLQDDVEYKEGNIWIPLEPKPKVEHNHRERQRRFELTDLFKKVCKILFDEAELTEIKEVPKIKILTKLKDMIESSEKMYRKNQYERKYYTNKNTALKQRLNNLKVSLRNKGVSEAIIQGHLQKVAYVVSKVIKDSKIKIPEKESELPDKVPMQSGNMEVPIRLVPIQSSDLPNVKISNFQNTSQVTKLHHGSITKSSPSSASYVLPCSCTDAVNPTG
ncbi:hypothetical protein KUTeg_024454 [Tegillarca granosa]|uniref:MGA conserved domain-containing protein n=1 Tax=Tegillarca granosa TaxID=220873 RepID=A0ABQ9DXD0_TEGGR|nr:hypothetical protein KUTeg_024454 [Tegillarca granosa]